MKKFLSILLILILVCSLAACKGNDKDKFKIPDNILTTEEYHAELDKLLKTQNYSNAEDSFLDKLDTLTGKLKDMIVYNMDDLTECTGTKYYVSNNGDDKNDGKSPETAWATLDKVNDYIFNEGDLVLFERGSMWRGYLSVKSNVAAAALLKLLKSANLCNEETVNE